MERQMFARGGAVQRFQAGGPAMPMQGDPMGAAPMQGTPVPGVPNQAQLEQMPLEGVMGMAQQSGIDPAQLEQMLGGMAGQFQGLDQAEDFEQVMNAMRGTKLLSLRGARSWQGLSVRKTLRPPPSPFWRLFSRL
jgi:hypothetical protein